MRNLAAVAFCLPVLVTMTTIVRPAAAFEVQSGGVPLSAAAVSLLGNRIGNVPPNAAGPSGAFPPWMGNGRTNGPALANGAMGGGLQLPGRAGGVATADRAVMNEQLFGIKR